MSFFKREDSEEILKDTGGSGQIYKSGIYDVNILAAIVQTNDKGARVIDLYIEHNEKPQMLFNAIRLDNNNGEANLQRKLLHKLLYILDIEELGDPVVAELPIGKNKALKEVEILPELADKQVAVRIQIEHSRNPNNGEIKNNKVIRNFFSIEENYATADELKNKPKEEWGKQHKLELEKYSTEDAYNGVTPEEVAEAKNKENNKPSGGFGSKEPASTRRFGRK